MNTNVTTAQLSTPYTDCSLSLLVFAGHNARTAQQYDRLKIMSKTS